MPTAPPVSLLLKHTLSCVVLSPVRRSHELCERCREAKLVCASVASQDRWPWGKASVSFALPQQGSEEWAAVSLPSGLVDALVL